MQTNTKKVYVIAQDGTPLMPCEPIIARLLLKAGKAKIKRKEPFTIKLLYESTKYTQELNLGVDLGSGTIGTAVSDTNGNILYMSKVEIRNDIHKKMEERKRYRRFRRNRLRYRKPRFLNRHNSFKKDRLNPTVKSKIQSHIKEIEYIKSILPITNLILETTKFDTAKMQNPNITSWGYQKGINYGYQNTHEYVLYRDNHTCQLCYGKHKDSKLEVHHIIPRHNHGADTQNNLITLCKTCHDKIHKEERKTGICPTYGLKGQVKRTLNHATQMNVISSQLRKYYVNCIETRGYITKANRLNLNISKDHNLDACVIASNGKQIQIKSNLYQKKSISKGDYQFTKGVRGEIKIPTGKIKGIRKFDKVKYLGKEYFVKGRMSSGYAILMDIEGNKINFSSMPKGKKTVKLENLKRMQSRKSIILERRVA